MNRLLIVLAVLLLPLGARAQSLSDQQIGKVNFEQKLGMQLPRETTFTG